MGIMGWKNRVRQETVSRAVWRTVTLLIRRVWLDSISQAPGSVAEEWKKILTMWRDTREVGEKMDMANKIFIERNIVRGQ